MFWFIVLSYGYKHKVGVLSEFPLVSLAVPVFNEEKTVVKTLESLLLLDYPNIEIIVVNDGSTDGTRKAVDKFISGRKMKNVILINQKNQGKGAALNTALKRARGRYFGVFDADCVADRSALMRMVPHFEKGVGAVIVAQKPHNPKGVIARMQRIEYISASFMRSLMSNVGTLHITHGALSLFDAEILRGVGGFDENNLTEDFEIAMRLRSNNYNIKFCEDVMNETNVPAKFGDLWRQRVRWFRGFIANNLKYKHMVLNKKYGWLGRFQIPLEIVVLVLVFASMIIFIYHVWAYFKVILFRILSIGWDSFFLRVPDFDELLFSFNFKIVFPIVITLLCGFYLYVKAHRFVGEKWRFYFPTVIYLFLYPSIRSVQWLSAFVLECAGARRRWR